MSGRRGHQGPEATQGTGARLQPRTGPFCVVIYRYLTCWAGRDYCEKVGKEASTTSQLAVDSQVPRGDDPTANVLQRE